MPFRRAAQPDRRNLLFAGNRNRGKVRLRTRRLSPARPRELTNCATLCRLAGMGREPRLTSQTLRTLAVLCARADIEVSGADIARVTKIASGSLYPILARLEQAGWAESRWEEDDPRDLGRPRRRLYTITGLGARKARTAIREFIIPFEELAWL